MAKRGIAPEVLLSQVRNTASWAFDLPNPQSFISRLENGQIPTAGWEAAISREDYLALLLAAHFTTVATFVPTDVDTQIRHHHWWNLETIEDLRASIAIIDEAASWDPRFVSNRVVDAGSDGLLSGHDGEWFSVRAGALGRAFSLDDRESITKLAEQIDAELTREAAIFTKLRDAKGREHDALRVSTLLAHNLGDLSRVVDEWPTKTEESSTLRKKLTRLGHVDSPHFKGVFLEAGTLNKALMADENHRYLAMRKPKSLRKHKSFAIPFGPFFDAWGEHIASSPLLEDKERADIVDALLTGHEQMPTCQSFLRALAGIHRKARGGLEKLAADHLPAKMRRTIAGGPIREALGISQEQFEARLTKRYVAARTQLVPRAEG